MNYIKDKVRAIVSGARRLANSRARARPDVAFASARPRYPPPSCLFANNTNNPCFPNKISFIKLIIPTQMIGETSTPPTGGTSARVGLSKGSVGAYAKTHGSFVYGTLGYHVMTIRTMNKIVLTANSGPSTALAVLAPSGSSASSLTSCAADAALAFVAASAAAPSAAASVARRVVRARVRVVVVARGIVCVVTASSSSRFRRARAAVVAVFLVVARVARVVPRRRRVARAPASTPTRRSAHRSIIVSRARRRDVRALARRVQRRRRVARRAPNARHSIARRIARESVARAPRDVASRAATLEPTR